MNSAVAAGCRPPFTASQWEELEHQALIYKYMISGAPVPPELVLPIRRSLASLPARLYHHPTLGYCTYYGKKLDPEPGRCRRTDGKKWRCSKDAHPDSKYCERHMHRSRSRSRKPVETQALSQSQSTSSTVTSLTPKAGGGVSGSRSITGSFQSIPLQSSVAGGSSLLGSCNAGASASQLNIDLGSYGMSSKEYRYLCGVKAQADGHSFFSEASGNARELGMDSLLESSWRQIPSRVSSFPLSRERTSSVLPSSYPQLQPVQDLEQAAISSLSKPQQQYSFFGCDFASSETGKVESHSLHPFFDEWPKTKDSWTGLEDERSNRTSFSTTQLSISIPMASSDFSTTSSRSPNGVSLF